MAKKEKTIVDEVKGEIGKTVIGNIILTVLFLIFGVVIYLNPYDTANTAGIILGIFLIVFGFAAIIEFFARSIIPIFTYKIFAGVLSIILGIFVIINPFEIIKILTFTLGIYLIIASIVKIVESIKLKKYGYDGWLLMLVISIILLIFGIFVTINPMASMDLVKVAGIFIILDSILEICNQIMIYSKASDIAKMFKKGLKD